MPERNWEGIMAQDQNLIIQGIEVDFPRAHYTVQNIHNREHQNHNH